MNFDTTLSELFLLLFFFLGWLYSSSKHKKSIQNPKERIKLPKSLALPFAGLGKDGSLSYPALIFQITILLVTCIISLLNLGVLSRQEAYHYMAWPIIFLGLLVFIIGLLRR